MICEYASSATSGKVYIYGHTLISQGNSWYYLYNAHGDVVKYINATGAVLKSYDYDAFGEEADPSTTDANPFRYAGQYFDDETGTYYLRARYYNPGNGRFTQQDAWGYGDPADPLSLNLYVYCYGNPVKYYDPSGNIPVETVGDIASAVGSFIEFALNPSLGNALFFAWDVASIFLPYVPGSYAAKGIKLLGKSDEALDIVKAFSKADNLADAAKVFKKNHKSILGSYKDIKKTVKTLGLKGFEVHHLIEKRFADTLGIKNVDDILAVALDKDTHKKITKEIRNIIGYKYDLGKKAVTGTASADLIWKVLVDVYKENGLEHFLPALKQYLLDNATNVMDIIDWRGV